MRIVINLEVQTENWDSLDEDGQRRLVHEYVSELIEDDSLDFDTEEAEDE